MADLITHMATVLLPASFVGGRYVPVVTFGVVLPDLAARVPGELLERLMIVGVPIPDTWLIPWTILHLPIPYALMCMVIALGFVPTDRKGVGLGLLAGGALHMGLDAFQDHHGLGYHLLFPFSFERYELGLIHSEATVAWAPWLGIATLLCWGIRWRMTTNVTDNRHV